MDATLDGFLKAAQEQAERDKKNRMACENCGWFAVRNDEKIGECHRYPPTLDAAAEEEWKHARVSRENVCGEFIHRRTGASFQADPFRQMAVRVARLEEENDRLRAAAVAERDES